jgi:TrkA domain protein
MTEMRETKLPGVGIRYDFTTSAGARVAVVAHRTGRRELVVYDRDDPDECRAVLSLDADDTRVLAELLGGMQLSEGLAAMQRLEGIAIDWLRIPSALAGRTLRDVAVRTTTGVSIVAVVRGDTTIPAPPPEFTFEAGDAAVAVGTPEGIQQLFAALEGG